MTTAHSLFTCPDSEVTLERIRELMVQNLPESFTLEYKEEFSPRLVKAIAAMANSYGGLILVGVTDQPQEDRLVGVPLVTMSQVVSACNSTFEPPWVPSIIPVALSQSEGTFILVLRVHSDRAPRPILIKGAAPIRLQGQNDLADRGRLAQLFSESPNQFSRNRPYLPMPQIQYDTEGVPSCDFILRSGLILPIADSMGWDSLSEIKLQTLCEALNHSPLATRLLLWMEGLTDGFNPFHRDGFSRANRAQLKWQAVTANSEVPYPVEAIAEIQLLGVEGDSFKTLHFTLDVIVKIRNYTRENRSISAPDFTWRLTLPDLYETLDSLIATLLESAIISVLTDIAGTDPSLAYQSAISYFLTGPSVLDLIDLSGLRQIPNTTSSSHGANLTSNPSLDQSIESDRQVQMDAWLTKIALDAELTGMEALLSRYHSS